MYRCCGYLRIYWHFFFKFQTVIGSYWNMLICESILYQYVFVLQMPITCHQSSIIKTSFKWISWLRTSPNINYKNMNRLSFNVRRRRCYYMWYWKNIGVYNLNSVLFWMLNVEYREHDELLINNLNRIFFYMIHDWAN